MTEPSAYRDVLIALASSLRASRLDAPSTCGAYDRHGALGFCVSGLSRGWREPPWRTTRCGHQMVSRRQRILIGCCFIKWP